MAKNILQSIGAVVAGAANSVILEVGTDALMHATGIFPKGEGSMRMRCSRWRRHIAQFTEYWVRTSPRGWRLAGR